MPVIKLKTKLKRVIATVVTIYEKAMRTIKAIDDKIAQVKAERATRMGHAASRTSKEVPLRDENGKPNREGIHIATQGGTCWYPNKFLEGKKHCDYCFMYPWCLAPCKNLKVAGTQPSDKNKAYFAEKDKEESLAYTLITSKPKTLGKKVLIKRRVAVVRR